MSYKNDNYPMKIHNLGEKKPSRPKNLRFTTKEHRRFRKSPNYVDDSLDAFFKTASYRTPKDWMHKKAL